MWKSRHKLQKITIKYENSSIFIQQGSFIYLRQALHYSRCLQLCSSFKARSMTRAPQKLKNIKFAYRACRYKQFGAVKETGFYLILLRIDLKNIVYFHLYYHKELRCLENILQLSKFSLFNRVLSTLDLNFERISGQKLSRPAQNQLLTFQLIPSDFWAHGGIVTEATSFTVTHIHSFIHTPNFRPASSLYQRILTHYCLGIAPR